LIKQK